jgi:hypothetical protein
MYMKHDRETKITIGFVVAAVIILAAQLFFQWATPAAAQSLSDDETTTTNTPTMLQVRILTSDDDLDWQGNIMGSDMAMSSISGEGDDTAQVRCDDDDGIGGFGTYSVVVMKMDDNDETLAVQIIDETTGKVLKEARTEADFGTATVSGPC